jgi:hypothetical protein
MSIDTNAPYKVPKEYEAKNKDFVPKTKPTSVVMIVLGGIVISAITIAGIIGIIIGANIAYKSIRDAIDSPKETEYNESANRA